MCKICGPDKMRLAVTTEIKDRLKARYPSPLLGNDAASLIDAVYGSMSHNGEFAVCCLVSLIKAIHVLDGARYCHIVLNGGVYEIGDRRWEVLRTSWNNFDREQEITELLAGYGMCLSFHDDYITIKRADDTDSIPHYEEENALSFLEAVSDCSVDITK